MSTYNGGRRGPNVSQFVRNLNTIHEPEESYPSLDDDLSLFTNSHFYDFETGQTTADFQPAKMETTADSQQASPQGDDSTSASTALGDLATIDFIGGDFAFSEFGTYTSPTLAGYGDGLNGLQTLPQASSAAEAVYSPTAPQQAGNGGYSAAGQALPPLAEKRKGSGSSGGAAGGTTTGGTGSHQRVMSFDVDDAAQRAAEEDKRRRNTAASARFRIKKKQREQALEKSAKEMQEKVAVLENRIQQLETENKWLKNLIMEKNDGTATDTDVTSMWRDFTKEQQQQGASATSGTAKASARESRTAESTTKAEPEN